MIYQGMECQETYRLITEYVERDLGQKERDLFERHVDNCSNCKAFFRTYQKTRDLVETLLCDQLPEELTDEINKVVTSAIKGNGT